jgi:exopolysaccharide biosynthesis predicted pyruvyltransferase EpsI
MSAELVGLYAKRLRELFQPLIGRGAPVALVDYPDSVNCGDHAVWLGEKRLLSELGAGLVYECSVRSYDAGALRERIGAGTILLHGGGNFGERYEAHDAFRAALLRDFPGNRIVCFPQQVTYLDNDYLERIASAFAAHPDVTLFARGGVAQQQMSRYFGSSARVELAPDMAFMLGRQARDGEPQFDVVWLARTDETGAGDQTESAARLASQAPEKFVFPPFPDGIEINFVAKQRPPAVLLTDWRSLVFENVEARHAFDRLGFDARSEVYLRRALHILSLGRLVITDRLHGHVLCLLLEIPHIFLNNQSGKNWNFYETWTRGTPLCRLARNPAEAWALARGALARLKEMPAAAWTWQGLGTPEAETGA